MDGRGLFAPLLFQPEMGEDVFAVFGANALSMEGASDGRNGESNGPRGEASFTNEI